jgi:hypothetical protein
MEHKINSGEKIMMCGSCKKILQKHLDVFNGQPINMVFLSCQQDYNPDDIRQRTCLDQFLMFVVKEIYYQDYEA